MQFLLSTTPPPLLQQQPQLWLPWLQPTQLPQLRMPSRSRLLQDSVL
jgi:hypothetical protein